MPARQTRQERSCDGLISNMHAISPFELYAIHKWTPHHDAITLTTTYSPQCLLKIPTETYARPSHHNHFSLFTTTTLTLKCPHHKHHSALPTSLQTPQPRLALWMLTTILRDAGEQRYLRVSTHVTPQIRAGTHSTTSG